MYSRSYLGNTQGQLSLPENYDGIAFLGPENPDTGATSTPKNEIPLNGDAIESPQPVMNKNPWEEPPTPPKKEEEKVESVFSGIGKSPLFGSLSGLFKGGGLGNFSSLKLPRLGTEEILIIAAAAFLFFSKDGDNECALMLLLLLLIN